jgi:type III pantothenate kinase
LPEQMPSRWALNTPGAIQSGVVYAVVAGMADFIEAWRREFPGSRIVLTGGDRARCLAYLQAAFPETASGAIADPHLIVWGMRAVISQQA